MMRRTILLAAAFALFLPWGMQAAAPAETDILIKGEGHSTVYYYAIDGQRYVFPNERTYASWYGDFENIVEIADADLAAIPLGGNVTARPGVRMVKIMTDPKVYAVAPGGVLRWIASEQVAAALYGPDWNMMIDDVPDVFFTDYDLGPPVETASDFDPAAASAAAPDISSDKGLEADEKPEPPGSDESPDTGDSTPEEPEPQAPSISAAPLPSTLLVNGTMALSRVEVNAPADMAVKSITWTIQKTQGVGLNPTAGSSVRIVGQGSTLSGAVGTVSGDCTAGAAMSCVLQAVFDAEYLIPAGASRTLELRMLVDSAGANDAVTTYVEADTGIVTGALTNAGLADGDSIAGTRHDFIWSDLSGIPHNDAVGGSADWTNGFLFDGLPTDAQSVTVP